MIEIDTESIVPIYSQLMYQIKLLVQKGDLLPGEALPSVRSLAGDIGINLHTVNKAYKLLAEEGLIEQEKKGFRISKHTPPIISKNYQDSISEKLREIVLDSLIYNVDLESLVRKLQEELKGVDTND